MSTTEPVSPIFYILFGIFIALVAVHFWRYLRRQFRSHSSDAHSKAFTVHLIDEAPPQTVDRKWQWDTLTPRETEIARLVAYGKRNAEIAHELHISVRTVETHLSHIYEKLQVRSRVELARVIRDLVD